MSIFANIVSVLTADIRTTLITLIIGFIVYKISKFYLKVFSFPPGPIPIPFLGGGIKINDKVHWATQLEGLAEKYGPVFTIWMGTTPLVLISDVDIGREVFRKNDFAGRPVTVFGRLMTRGKDTDIVMGDYGHRWEALRRVAHSAVQKYSTTDKLVYLASDCIDQMVTQMVDKEGLNKPFKPYEYIYNTFLNILATSAFGERYDLDDPEYKAIKYVLRDSFNEANKRFMYWELIDIFRRVDPVYKKIHKAYQQNFELLNKKFTNHYKDYNESVVRDFCDTLITAKNDALREGKESAPYLTDENLTFALFDLFFAGTETSQTAFRWILFLITYYPEVLKNLREEIENQIGDRIPTHEDRNRCHYTQAVISETLRHRNSVPLGVNHKAIVTSKIGDHTIPEGTQVVVFQGHILHNEKYWSNPQEFRPERFLENGKYITTRPKAFIPFGIGRRVCLGEKLALADLFLAVVRFIQKTADYEIVLHYSGDTQPDTKVITEFVPKDYEISLRNK